MSRARQVITIEENGDIQERDAPGEWMPREVSGPVSVHINEHTSSKDGAAALRRLADYLDGVSAGLESQFWVQPVPVEKSDNYFPNRLGPGDDRYGSCPECKTHDGCINVGPNHWFHCEHHKMAWYAGSNLFETWREETEAEWKANAEHLSGYKIVKPCPSRDYPAPDTETPADKHHPDEPDGGVPF